MRVGARAATDGGQPSGRALRRRSYPSPRPAVGRPRERMLRRRRRTMVLLVLAVVVGAALAPKACSAWGRDGHSSLSDTATTPSPPASPTPSPPPVPTLRAGTIDLVVDGFMSWALLDRKTGESAGSANLAVTSTTESMIKIWIVADFLRRSAEAGREPPAEELAMASTAIRDSDDTAAQRLFNRGGGAPVIGRLISTCGLIETKAVVPPGSSVVWWSYTQMSARDAVRMGACVADGRAAGPRWTAWVMAEMAQVRGTAEAKDQFATRGGGRWGIIDGLPQPILAQGVGIKNGWTLHAADGTWHVNCLAVSPAWVLAVLIKYPGKYGLQYGANTCKQVAQQLVTPRPG